MHIHTIAIRRNLGLSILHKDTLTCRVGEPGIEPPSFWWADERSTPWAPAALLCFYRWWEELQDRSLMSWKQNIYSKAGCSALEDGLRVRLKVRNFMILLSSNKYFFICDSAEVWSLSLISKFYFYRKSKLNFLLSKKIFAQIYHNCSFWGLKSFEIVLSNMKRTVVSF